MATSSCEGRHIYCRQHQWAAPWRQTSIDELQFTYLPVIVEMYVLYHLSQWSHSTVISCFNVSHTPGWHVPIPWAYMHFLCWLKMPNAQKNLTRYQIRHFWLQACSLAQLYKQTMSRLCTATLGCACFSADSNSSPHDTHMLGCSTVPQL